MTAHVPTHTPAARRLGEEEVASAVRAALARTLRRPPAEIRMETLLEDDLGLDSMALIEVNIAIEEQLRVAIPAGESPETALRTVGDLVRFVRERVDGAEVTPC
jgi:acyl carrier protein